MVRTPHALAWKARQHRIHGLVSRVVQNLPADILPLLDNVAIVVEDEPAGAHLDESDVASGSDLLGLYQGIPRTERDSSYSLVTPDRIIIFAGPLERACTSRRELDEQIRITVLHELGHHLGFDEIGLETLGLS